jgi:hypothetical protein
LTGKKHEQKIYKHHSGFIGGLKEVPISRMRERRPEEVSPFPVLILNLNGDIDDRLSEERFLECYQRIHSDKDVWID